MEIEQLSEYIIKVSDVLPKDLCASLAKSVAKDNNLGQNLVASDIEKLSNIVSKYYEIYYHDYMPPIDLTEKDSQTYNLELDALLVEKSSNELYNLGGKGKSHRFLSFTFVISEGQSEIQFPSQEVTNNCMSGDLYIIPSKFTHRFHIKTNKNNTFNAISIYTCI